ncbi:hypothetical protein [Noviluteimonas gilva]|uniref:Uncharacterized protein n=1 Tax=Noviluteimonas gilva TaxID=2682097 RepID=A0A7C9M2U3_9GAMM|nr:hypothetical protein [Lysobacter gilvus]MUV13602.1 hypothetical protein [Lysobacter gilvus]
METLWDRLQTGERDFACRVTSADLEESRPLAERLGLRVLVVSEADGWADVEIEDGNFSAWRRVLS